MFMEVSKTFLWTESGFCLPFAQAEKVPQSGSLLHGDVNFAHSATHTFPLRWPPSGCFFVQYLMFPQRELFICSTSCRSFLYIMPCICVGLIAKAKFSVNPFQSFGQPFSSYSLIYQLWREETEAFYCPRRHLSCYCRVHSRVRATFYGPFSMLCTLQHYISGSVFTVLVLNKTFCL